MSIFDDLEELKKEIKDVVEAAKVVEEKAAPITPKVIFPGVTEEENLELEKIQRGEILFSDIPQNHPFWSLRAAGKI